MQKTSTRLSCNLKYFKSYRHLISRQRIATAFFPLGKGKLKSPAVVNIHLNRYNLDTDNKVFVNNVNKLKYSHVNRSIKLYDQPIIQSVSTRR